MIDLTRFAYVLTLFIVLAAGCSSAPEPPRESAVEPPAPSPVEQSPSPGAADATVPPPTQTVPAETASAEPVEPEPPEPASPPAAVTGSPDSSGVADPGGTVEVAATRPGLTRIGAAKCKLCHKVQHASWSESAHAKRTPPLDCEGCHGPGSEYKGLNVMKDPEKARAAGLVDPTEAFCSRCHTSGWSDDMLQRAHAHDDEES
jgi:hypothetical protein